LINHFHTPRLEGGVLLWIATVVLCLASIKTQAQPLNLEQNGNIQSLDVTTINRYTRLIDHIYIYRDLNRSTEINQLDKIWLDGGFEVPDRDVSGLGLVKYDVWGKFSLYNSSDVDLALILEYPDHVLAYMELFESRPSNSQSGYKSLGLVSYYYPYSVRPVEASRYAYRVVIPAHTKKNYYLFFGVDKAGMIYPDMRVWREKAFARFHTTESFAFGMLFGYLSLVIIFSLVYFYTSRNVGLLY